MGHGGVEMTFRRFLKEEYLTSIKSRTGDTCEIFKNPDSGEFRDIVLANTIDSEQRAYLDPKTGNVYMWAGSTGEHGEVAYKNKFPSYYLPIYVDTARHRVTPSLYSWPDVWNLYDANLKRQAYEIIKSNKYLKRYAGDNFELYIIHGAEIK